MTQEFHLKHNGQARRAIILFSKFIIVLFRKFRVIIEPNDVRFSHPREEPRTSGTSSEMRRAELVGLSDFLSEAI